MGTDPNIPLTSATAGVTGGRGDSPPANSGSPVMSPRSVMWFGIYHVLVAAAILYCLIKVWPHKIPSDPDVNALQPVQLFGAQFLLTEELQMIWVVLLSGGLGSYVHAATSFVNYAGAGKFIASWRWWYLLRPFIGGSLALGFYFGVRAGFFASNANAHNLNVLGFAATAFMVGMFTRQATEKLSQLFDVLFKVPDEEKPTQDKLHDNGGGQ